MICRYLLPAELQVSQFVHVIRKRIELPPEKALILFINNTVPPTNAVLGAMYEQYKDQDGFLYITYTGEETFGAASNHV